MSDTTIACDLCGEAMQQDRSDNFTCSECPNFVPAEDAWQHD
jgi:hypothetical protein